jgi:hypothetical protein
VDFLSKELAFMQAGLRKGRDEVIARVQQVLTLVIPSAYRDHREK